MHFQLRRQIEKDAADNVRHELDDQFASLRELIYAPNLSVSIDDSKPPTAGDDEEPPEKANAATDSVAARLLPPGDDYDHHVRELAFDKRARPKDRTKTEEELALEAKEELEEAERKRRRRMLGLPENDSEDGIVKKGKKRKRDADDLDDDLDLELGDYEDLGAGLEGGMLLEREDNDIESGDDEQDSSEEESGGSSRVDDAESLEDEGKWEEGEEEGKTAELVPSSSVTKEKKKGKAKAELPFTFPCPESHEDFLEIVEGLEDTEVCTVVQRILALYHASLSPDNKFKLQV